MVFVKWLSGDTDQFTTREEALASILSAFVSSGENWVEDVWEGGDDGEERALVIKWSATFEERL